MAKTKQYRATGKRKTATASVHIFPGTGNITVNRKPLEEYFDRKMLLAFIKQPLEATNTIGKYDVKARVKGGGIAGQAAALRHGISKALTLTDERLRQQLKQLGLLTRDPRMKERKKYGQPGARKRFQYSKR